MMDPKLLDKYWNAETSLEEEARLLSDAMDDTRAEAAYFRLIAAERQSRSRLTPDDIRRKAQASPAVPTVAVVRPITRQLAAAAAVLALVLSGVGLWRYAHRTAEPTLMAEAYMTETYDDPEAALEEVKQALAYMSKKFNRSQEQAFRQIKKAGEYADIIK